MQGSPCPSGTEGQKHPHPRDGLCKASCFSAAPDLTTTTPLILTTWSLKGASKHFNHLANQIVGRAAFPTVTLFA